MADARTLLFGLLCAGVCALQAVTDSRHFRSARSAAELLTVFAGRGFYSEGIVTETCLRRKPNCPPSSKVSLEDLRWRPSLLVWSSLVLMRNAWTTQNPANALRLSGMAEAYALEALSLQGSEEYRAYATKLHLAATRVSDILSQENASSDARPPDDLIEQVLSSQPPASAVEKVWGGPS